MRPLISAPSAKSAAISARWRTRSGVIKSCGRKKSSPVNAIRPRKAQSRGSPSRALTTGEASAGGSAVGAGDGSNEPARSGASPCCRDVP